VSEIDILAIKRGTIVAPAGCGKTHLIANALSRHDGRKPILVLTHTNAGVCALKARLDKAGIPIKNYRLATIDGWSMKMVSTFPLRSLCDPEALKLHNPSRDYGEIRRAAVALIGAGHIRLCVIFDLCTVDS
jgi:hypothetical protein